MSNEKELEQQENAELGIDSKAIEEEMIRQAEARA